MLCVCVVGLWGKAKYKMFGECMCCVLSLIYNLFNYIFTRKLEIS
jgi:hypothetical protein